MRYTLTAFITLLTCFSLSSQSLIWSDPVDVSAGHGNLRPRLALTSGDHPVVVWGGGTGNQPVYVARWNGSGFASPIAVSPAGIDPYCASWVGPDIAARGDDVWVVFDAEVVHDFRVFSVKSTDGGTTFGDTVNVGGYSGLTRFTAIGVSENSNPAVTFMDHDPGYADPRYMVANTPDGGATWNIPVNASNSLTGNEVCDCCPSEVVTDGMNQILMFRNNDSNLRDMWASVSSDGGESFTFGSDVDEASWMISACPSTGPDGFVRGDSVLMTWMTGGYDGPARVMLTTTSKVTSQGGANLMVSPGGEEKQNYPRIHGDDQVFGVAYQESVNGSQECLFAYSTNGTTQFDHANIRINDLESGNQTNPDVIYSNGVFHFTYQDGHSGNVIYRTATLQDVGFNEYGTGKYHLYPNPARNNLNVIAPENENVDEILVLNSQNKIVKRMTPGMNDGIISIDLSNLTDGIYFVMIKSQNNFMVQKLLKIN